MSKKAAELDTFYFPWALGFRASKFHPWTRYQRHVRLEDAVAEERRLVKNKRFPNVRIRAR